MNMYNIRKNSDLFWGEKGQECFVVYMQTTPTSLTLKQNQTLLLCLEPGIDLGSATFDCASHGAPHTEG